MLKKGLVLSLLLSAQLTGFLHARNFVNNAYNATKAFVTENNLTTPLQQVALLGTLAAYHEGGLTSAQGLAPAHATVIKEWAIPVKKVAFDDPLMFTLIGGQTKAFAWIDEKLSGSPDAQNTFNELYTTVKHKINELHLDIPLQHIAIITALIMYHEHFITTFLGWFPEGMWGKQTIQEYTKIITKAFIGSHLIALTKNNKNSLFNWIDGVLSGEDAEPQVEPEVAA